MISPFFIILIFSQCDHVLFCCYHSFMNYILVLFKKRVALSATLKKLNLIYPNDKKRVAFRYSFFCFFISIKISSFANRSTTLLTISNPLSFKVAILKINFFTLSSLIDAINNSKSLL